MAWADAVEQGLELPDDDLELLQRDGVVALTEQVLMVDDNSRELAMQPGIVEAAKEAGLDVLLLLSLCHGVERDVAEFREDS